MMRFGVECEKCDKKGSSVHQETEAIIGVIKIAKRRQNTYCSEQGQTE